MLDKLFPRSLENSYRGYRTALWIFGFVIAIRALQSSAIIFNGYSTVVGADGIPLDTYPADAAQTVVGLFGILSVWRLIFCLLGVLVLVRYRNAVTLMFVLLLVNYFGAQLVSQFIPLVRVGTPPGSIVNLILLVVTVIGLGLSILPRRVSQ
jgi:hypothetical protein